MTHPTLTLSNPADAMTEDPAVVATFVKSESGKTVRVRYIRQSGKTYSVTRPTRIARAAWRQMTETGRWVRA